MHQRQSSLNLEPVSNWNIPPQSHDSLGSVYKETPKTPGRPETCAFRLARPVSAGREKND